MSMNIPNKEIMKCSSYMFILSLHGRNNVLNRSLAKDMTNYWVWAPFLYMMTVDLSLRLWMTCIETQAKHLVLKW